MQKLAFSERSINNLRGENAQKPGFSDRLLAAQNRFNCSSSWPFTWVQAWSTICCSATLPSRDDRGRLLSAPYQGGDSPETPPFFFPSL